MKQTELNGYRLLLVPVPEGSHSFSVNFVFCGTVSYYEIETNTKLSNTHIWRLKYIPAGDWQLLGPGLASEIREEEAAGVVECKKHPFLPNLIYYKNYLSGNPLMWIHHATASLASFVHSQEMEPERVVILIYKQKGGK